MKVLVIGSGGREHALVWKISQSKLIDKIYALPGNGGISDIAEIVSIELQDLEKISEFVKQNQIDLTIVGPEAPLVAGIVDLFQRKNLKIFGPNRETAQLEGSKVFAKKFMSEFNIPTASFEVFDNFENAINYLKDGDFPIVIKADGLCAGKGVIVVNDFSEGKVALKKIMQEKIFGHAGDKVIIEDYLSGEEASIIAISDGKNLVALASSQDHKRVYDNDEGPNTGGMGAYSPAPVAEGDVFEKAIKKILEPAIAGMAKKGIPFRGVLYAGIMIVDNEPYVLEFNVRFGDPEIQAILPRMESDLLGIVLSALEGNLDKFEIKWSKDACVCVVLASGGYPESYEREKEIYGLDKVKELDDVIVFHAGTKKVKKDGREIFLTNGGRVLNVTALGKDIRQAKERAYQAIELISFDKMHYRRDISDKALRRLNGGRLNEIARNNYCHRK